MEGHHQHIVNGEELHPPPRTRDCGRGKVQICTHPPHCPPATGVDPIVILRPRHEVLQEALLIKLGARNRVNKLSHPESPFNRSTQSP